MTTSTTVYLVIIPNGMILAAYSTETLACEHARGQLGARVLALAVRDCLPVDLDEDDANLADTVPASPRAKLASKLTEKP